MERKLNKIKLFVKNNEKCIYIAKTLKKDLINQNFELAEEN